MRQRLLRFGAVSMTIAVLGQLALIGFFYFANFSARAATIAACVVSGIPGYYLNRAWVWGKSGRSHLRREVLPFWAMTLLGLVLSTWFAGYAEDFGREHFSTRGPQTVFVGLASVAAFGVLWILRFAVFNRFVFGSEGADVPQ